MVRIAPDGRQETITQRRSQHFQSAESEASRYFEGTLPNGMAFDANGNFLISNFGTDRLELMSRDGISREIASIDGQPLGKVNFVLRDSKDRVWITASTRLKNWMHALGRILPTATSPVTRTAPSASSPTASTSPTRSGSTRKKSSSTSSRRPAAASRGSGSTTVGTRSSARCLARARLAGAHGQTASRSTRLAISGARS